MILTSRFSVSLALAWQGGSLTFGQSDSAVMLDLAQFYAGPPGDVGPAGEGVPTGGTAGQVLAKASGDDFDTAWIDAGSASSVAWDDVTGKPTTFPPSGHTHAIADVTGLQAALDGKATAAQGGLADSAVQPGDPISDLIETGAAKIMTAAERTKLAGIATGATANATDAQLRDRATHTGAQAIATVTGLQAALDGKQPLATVLTNTTASFTAAQETKLAAIAAGATANATDAQLRDRATHTGAQAISTVTGLQAALDGKAASVHTHAASEISDSTAPGRAILTAATAAAQRTALGLGTAATTAASDYATAAQGGLADSAVQPGDPVSDLAETASAKIMTAAERTKLAGIEAGAQANVATDLSYTPSTRVLASSTGADATLPLVSSTDAGLAPASGGGTTNFLRADGAWAAPAGGGGGGGGGFSFFMKPATGLYVSQASVGGALGSLAQVANRNTVAPFIPQRSFSIDQVGLSVTVLATGASAKVVIYAADADGRPDALLVESADISCAATGTYFTALSFSFVAGQTYWIGVRSSSNPTLRTVAAASQPVLSLSGGATPVIHTTLIKTETYADPAGAWGYALAQHSNQTVPLVLMRVA